MESIKVCIISDRQEFIETYKPLLEQDFNCQWLNPKKSSMTKITHFEPRFCVIDCSSLISSMISELKRMAGPNTYMIALGPENSSIEENAFLSGADHYLEFDSDYNKLQVRIKALARKSAQPSTSQASLQPTSSITIGSLVIFPNDFIIKRNGTVINSTPIQFRLFVTFISYKDQLLSRAWLKENIWDGSDISPRSIDAQISKLKKLLPEIDSYIKNVYGKGYIFSWPESNNSSYSKIA